MRSLIILIAVSILTICSAFATYNSDKQLDSTYTFGAFDKISGKRLAATFKISFTNLDPLVIQGTLQSDIQFKPATHGHYEIEISMPSYIPKRIILNVENLGAGKTNFKELLERSLDEYIILITDAKDKQIITTAKVKVFDDSKQEVEAKVNPKTGEWKTMLDVSKNYRIEIEAAGYQGTSLEIQGVDITKNNVKTPSKFISVSLQKNDSRAISFMAVDAITKKPIDASYRVLRPEEEVLTGKSEKTNPYTIVFNPKKKFTIEVSADGYKSVTEPISFENTQSEKESAKALLKRFELSKETYSFLFKIIDAQTKENIASTRMRIINLNNKQSIAAKIEKDGFSANLSPDSDYSIEVESEGYDQANQNIDLKDLIVKEKFEQEIFLVRKSVERFKLVVVDEETDKHVPGANLRVFNTKNEPILISTTAVQSEWQADLKIAESYTAEVKMQGYLAHKVPLLKSNKTIILRIRKVPAEEVYFITTDFYTKNILPTAYKLTSGNTVIEGDMNPEKTRFKAKLLPDNTYQIEATSAGYPPYKEAVSKLKAVNRVITLELKKTGYSFTFNPIDSKTREPIPNVKVSLVDNNNQPLPVSNNVASMVSPQNLEKTYALSAQAANYKPYKENIEMLNLAVANFKHDILMEKIEIVQAPPPVKENPPPVLVEEKPKVEELPKEEVPAKIVLPTVESKPANATITDEYFKEIEVGKRIKLENVYFDQSQPIIKPQSHPELDRLVNLLKQNPKIIIEIIGHTDNVGDPRMNLYLSELRAKAVSNYLFNKGIQPNRLAHSGKGQQQPVAANDTEENRQKNRRVEFVVVEN